MTMIAPPGLGTGNGPAASRVPWHRLAWVTWRQHRAALAAFAVLAGLIATAMAATGLALHAASLRHFSSRSQWVLLDDTQTLLELTLLLLPVLAGLFLGAPLVARNFETGTIRFSWVQGANRTKCLLAAVALIALLLALIAVGLGLEFRWWATPLLVPGWAWRPDLFGLNPPAFAGWIMLGFSLGVTAGAAIGRTVPAMAATFACYPALWYQVAARWRISELMRLRQAGLHSRFSALRSGYTPFWYLQRRVPAWLTYNPGGRWAEYQWIEFGWLIAVSALLIAGTVILIRRRAA